jgi:hypothetical protein
MKIFNKSQKKFIILGVDGLPTDFNSSQLLEVSDETAKNLVEMYPEEIQVVEEKTKKDK